MGGLYSKYTVINNQTRAEVYDCFVLKPMSDESARLALLYYADICDNEALKNDIKAWLGNNEQTMICEQCKECWNYMVSEVGCYGSTKICEHFQTDDQDEHLVTSENMAEHSFICNACVYFGVNSSEELDATKCENCNGQGREWQPRNKELYEKDSQKFMEHLLLGSI